MAGEIVTRTHPEQDLTVYTVSGAFTIADINRVIEDFFSADRTTLTLWDFTAADFGQVVSTDPQQIAGFSKKYEGQRSPGSKTALVFSQDLGFGLGRMFEIIRQLDESQTSYRAFRSHREAMDWLGLPVSD